MPKSWYTIKAEAGAETAEVSILDYIGGWGVEARTFLAEFRALKAPNVRVFINSPGGSVFEALAIFNGMRATGKKIEVNVLGVAASAASYIAMAGDKIVMPENTFMFVHNPINGVYGNAEEMREMADVLDKIGASLTATYARRWTGTDEELAATLADETYLSAAECLARGFCDEVTPAITAEAAFEVDALPEQLRAVFKAAAPTRIASAEIERIAAAAGVADYAGTLALDSTLTTPQAVQERAEQLHEIVALCRITGRPEAANGYARARTSLADVRAALAKAEAEASPHINTAPPQNNLGPKASLNPVAFWANNTKTWRTK